MRSCHGHATALTRRSAWRRPLSRHPQGISQWSERRDATSSWNKRSTFSPSDPSSAADRQGGQGYTGRPDRVQVLPTGPDHTFKSSPSPPAANGGSRLYKTTSTHRVSSPVGIGSPSPLGSSPLGSPLGSPYRASPASPYRDSPTYRDSPYREDSDEPGVSTLGYARRAPRPDRRRRGPSRPQSPPRALVLAWSDC